MSTAKILPCLIISFSVLIFPEMAMGQRGTLNISIPEVEATPIGGNRQIWIRSVTDARAYQDRPRTPDIPSMGRGLDRTTEAERARAIGRERDGYGRARRNVFLPRDKTVKLFVTKLLEHTLTQLGYTVVLDDNALDDNALDDNALILDADVNKFWAWVNVDPAAGWIGSSSPMHLEGEIQTRINIQDGKNTRQLITAGRGSHRIFAGLTQRNWLRTYDLFLEDYIQNLQTALQQTQ